MVRMRSRVQSSSSAPLNCLMKQTPEQIEQRFNTSLFIASSAIALGGAVCEVIGVSTGAEGFIRNGHMLEWTGAIALFGGKGFSEVLIMAEQTMGLEVEN